MRRWGDAETFLERIDAIRARAPDAALRSSFILGYPGETEEDHDLLLSFLAEARLDWAGFFTFSEESGTYAEGLSGAVAAELALERLRECSELQDAITAERRAELVGERLEVLVDEPGVAAIASRGARDRRRRPRRGSRSAVGEFHKVVVDGSGRAGPLGRDVSEPLPPSASASYTFGPSALNTPANAITVARLLATPVLVAMIAVHGPGGRRSASRWLSASPTASTVGWRVVRARPRSGAFLDPLADKAAVVGALCALAAKGELAWLPVAIIAAREVWMSLYRIAVGRRGVSIPAAARAPS